MKVQRASRALVVLCALLLVVGVATPVKAGGPSQPEAMQFEPVDITDVVNLATGDFVYSLPLMTVPGPNGGYPISMSYHSGIGLNQEATWVGLGWTLNAGAINRIMTGYPDEFEGGDVITTYRADGEPRYAISFGIQYGIGYGSVGLNMTMDVNSGNLGVNAVASVTPFGESGIKGFHPGIGLSGGTSGFSAGIDLKGSRSVGGLNLGGAISVASNGALSATGNVSDQNGTGLSAGPSGVRMMAGNGNRAVGFTLSSHGMGASYSTSSGRGFSMTTAGSGSVKSTGVTIPIPLPGNFFATIGFSKHQWKLDEKHHENGYGYASAAAYSALGVDEDDREMYEVFDGGKHGDVKYLYPSQDSYSVSAQGLSGSFKPFMDAAIRLNNDEGGGELSRVARIFGDDDDVVYRFLGDQGGNMVVTEALWGDNYSNINSIFSGNNRRQGVGSKLIDPIFNGKDLIGFVIKDEQGKVYEFAQPVYSINQYSWSRDESPGNDLEYIENTYQVDTPYPYQWLLTSIKGPDWIDRNGNNEPDSGDWGTWVSFNYSTAQDNLWRAPFVGASTFGLARLELDPDDDHRRSYSWGKKESVFLESIETATHIAKFIDRDSYNRISPYYPGDWAQSEPPVLNRISNYSYGIDCDYQNTVNSLSNDEPVLKIWYLDGFRVKEKTYYRDAMGTTASASSTITGNCIIAVSPSQNDVLAYRYIGSLESEVNTRDPNQRGRELEKIQLYTKSVSGSPQELVSEVKFEYDYSLRENFPTSDYVNENGIMTQGSLALKSVSFYGRGGQPSSPSYRFSYGGNGAGNPDWQRYAYDAWGSYRYTGSGVGNTNNSSSIDKTPQNKEDADRVAAWSLTRIETPVGSSINIHYESDDYYYVNGMSPIHEGNSYVTTTIRDYNENPDGTFEIIRLKFGNSDDMEIVDNEYSVGDSIFVIMSASIVSVINKDVCSQKISDIYTSGGFRVVEFESPCLYEREIVDGAGGNGFTLMKTPRVIYGGGSRVSRIELRSSSEVYATRYRYVTEDGRSSGVASSLPSEIEVRLGAQPWSDILHESDLAKKLERVHAGHGTRYGGPSPAVMYSRVVVENVDANNLGRSGKTIYGFYTSLDYPYDGVGSNVDNRSGIYGKPKYVSYYSQSNNEIDKTEEYMYAFSDGLGSVGKVRNVGSSRQFEAFGSTLALGLAQEKYRGYNESGGEWRRTRSYQNVFQHGVRSVEYSEAPDGSRTELTSESYTIGWDAISGRGIETASAHADGGTTFTRSIPAHWIYLDLRSKNMLTQPGMETTYLDRSLPFSLASAKNYAFDKEDVLSSSLTTWAQDLPVWSSPDATLDPNPAGGIWRMNDTYIYDRSFRDGDQRMGFEYPTAAVLDYVGTGYREQSSTTPWRMTSNVTTYDRYSHPVESVSRDGSYTASFYSEDETRPLAIATRAALDEALYVPFSAWESLGPGNGMCAADIQDGTTSYDQGSCLLATQGPSQGRTAFVLAGSSPQWSVPQANKTYTVDAYVKPKESGAQIELRINGQTEHITDTVNGGVSWWYPIRISGVSNGASVQFNGQGYLDYVRIYPDDARMQHFDYDPVTQQVTVITDTNMNSRFFEYDDAGRLVRVRDFERAIVQEYEYDYARFGDRPVQTFSLGTDPNASIDPIVVIGLPFVDPGASENYNAYASGGGNVDCTWYSRFLPNAPVRIDWRWVAVPGGSNTNQVTIDFPEERGTMEIKCEKEQNGQTERGILSVSNSQTIAVDQ